MPIQSLLDTHNTLVESSAALLSLDQTMEWGENPTYLRDGLRPDTLRKLRRGHWSIQDTIDLHGANREEARHLLAEFLGSCSRRGIRCVKMIHGKGLRSPNKEPVIRSLLRGWLVQLDDVLAYCEAPENSGGSGATLVLLSSK